MIINEKIRLQALEESDFDQLIAEIPDARFLLQWAGPKYTYPLDASQLRDTLLKTTGDKPSFKVFKAVLSETSETIGHIQLMNINYNASTCVLGRVLIFAAYRGEGLSKAMVKPAIEYTFNVLGLNEIAINVFDFNASAIALYKGLGFLEYEVLKNARPFQGKNWNIIKMNLNRARWQDNNRNA